MPCDPSHEPRIANLEPRAANRKLRTAGCDHEPLSTRCELRSDHKLQSVDREKAALVPSLLLNGNYSTHSRAHKTLVYKT